MKKSVVVGLSKRKSALRPPPFIRLSARRVAHPLHVHSCTRTDLPRPFDRSRLRPGYIACPLRSWLTHCIITFGSAFHIYTFVAHGLNPQYKSAVLRTFPLNPLACQGVA